MIDRQAETSNIDMNILSKQLEIIQYQLPQIIILNTWSYIRLTFRYSNRFELIENKQTVSDINLKHALETAISYCNSNKLSFAGKIFCIENRQLTCSVWWPFEIDENMQRMRPNEK